MAHLFCVELSKSLELHARGVSLTDAVLLGGTGPAKFTLHLPDLLLKLGAQIGLIDGFDLIQSFLGCCLGLWDE